MPPVRQLQGQRTSKGQTTPIKRCHRNTPLTYIVIILRIRASVYG